MDQAQSFPVWTSPTLNKDRLQSFKSLRDTNQDAQTFADRSTVMMKSTDPAPQRLWISQQPALGWSTARDNFSPSPALGNPSYGRWSPAFDHSSTIWSQTSRLEDAFDSPIKSQPSLESANEQSPLKGLLPIDQRVQPILTRLRKESRATNDQFAFYRQYELVRKVESRLLADLKEQRGADLDHNSLPTATPALTPQDTGPARKSHQRLTSRVVKSSQFFMWSPEIDAAFIEWSLRMSPAARRFAWEQFGVPTEPHLPPNPTCSSPFPLEISLAA